MKCKTSADLGLVQWDGGVGSALTVAAHDSNVVIDFNRLKPKGFFSVNVKTTSAGAAVLKLQYMVSYDGTNFDVPKNKDGIELDNIVTSHAVGENTYEFNPVPAPFYMLKATVSGAATTTTKVIVGAASEE